MVHKEPYFPTRFPLIAITLIILLQPLALQVKAGDHISLSYDVRPSTVENGDRLVKFEGGLRYERKN